MPASKQLAALAAKDPRVSEYEFDADGHWLYLREHHMEGVHFLHEDTVSGCLDALSQCTPCDCPECSAPDPYSFDIGSGPSGGWAA